MAVKATSVVGVTTQASMTSASPPYYRLLCEVYTVEWYNVVHLTNSTEVLRHIFLEINATFPTYEFIGYFNEKSTPELN